MTTGLQDWLVFLMDVVSVAVLGAAIAYGVVHTRCISARKRQQRDQATRELYDRLQ